ncbi:TPA: MFS transporter [Enterobacter hormaechei]|nr:MFS transporter [Enterobacter hormaechei]
MPQRDPYAPREWQPHEKPALLGSPSTPEHPTPKRIAYGVVGLLVCLTGALGNAVVTANLQNLQGTFGAWSTEIAWLPAVYVMTNVSINLLLVKFRQQYGLRAFTEGFLVLYVLVTFFHLFVNDLSSALMVRAAHGMVAAALSSLGIYYQIQAWPAKHRLKALTIGITGSSLAIPLARLFSTELLQLDEWRGLYFFELGLALISLACVMVLKLPPGDRRKVFEKKDFITFFLLAPGMALLCAVLSLGRLDWWFEAPWIGWALALSLVLMIVASLLDSQSNNLTRPDQLIFSQFLLGFGSAFFLAPAMLAAIGGVIADPRNLVSFSVMFGMSQNLGGLLGSAILGTFQTWREKYHSSLLADQLTTLNPLVNERIQLYTQMYKSLIGDSSLLGTQAITQLQTVTALEANILAYNDTYLLTASIATATLVWILWRLLRLRITARMALKNATGNK